MLALPFAVFIVSVFATLIVGPFHPHPVAQIGTPMSLHATEAIGIVLILKAFAAGCSAVTGVEAIANGVPAFKQPRVRTAQRTEFALGALLGGDADRDRDADPRSRRRPARRRHDARPADGRGVRDRLAVLRLEPGGDRGARTGGEHELRRPARADEHPRPRPSPPPRLLSSRRAARLPLRDRRARGGGGAAADRGRCGHQQADPAVRDRCVHRVHDQPDRARAPLARRSAPRGGARESR